MGEIAHPVLDEGGGHRLGADVHQPPLGQAVVLQLQLTTVQGGQNVLAPGHQQPDDGAALVGDGIEDGLGGVALEQDGPAAGEQGAEPVHLGAGVVQGRDAEEYVLVTGLVVDGLHPSGLEQGLVLEEDGLGEAGGAGGVVDGRVILILDEHLRGLTGAVGGGGVVVLGKGGAVLSHKEEQAAPGQGGRHVLHPADELRAEEEHIHVGQLDAVLDLLGSVAEVQRDGDGSGLQNAEIDGQPLQAVHQQDSHLVPLLHPAGEEHVGHPVGLLVEDAPGDLPAVGDGGCGLDELIFLPRDPVLFLDLRVDLHQGGLAAVELVIALQQVGNGHLPRSFPKGGGAA